MLSDGLRWRAAPLVGGSSRCRGVDAAHSSGMMERHPKLQDRDSHTGGSLPYQAGRMDKNSKAPKLPRR